MVKQKKDPGLKKGKSSFNLVGTAKITDFTFTVDKTSEKTGYIYSRINLGIDCGNGNIVYSEMMGGYYPNGSSKVYAHGKKADGKDDYENQLVLDWDERLNPKILVDIGNQSFIRIGIEKDTKGNISTNMFLSPYDAIDYLQANLKDGTIVTVSGDLEHSVYDGETQTKKKIKSIFAFLACVIWNFLSILYVIPSFTKLAPVCLNTKTILFFTQISLIFLIQSKLHTRAFSPDSPPTMTDSSQLPIHDSKSINSKSGSQSRALCLMTSFLYSGRRRLACN